MIELAIHAKGVDASKLVRELLVNLYTKRVEGKGVIIMPDMLVEFPRRTRAL